MAKFYVESNNEGAKYLFNKRAYYKSENTSRFDSFTKFKSEKRLYGRVGRDFVPIYANANNDGSFKTILSTNSQQSNMRALNFVVDAFEDMSQKFKQSINQGRIDDSDQYLSNLKAYTGFVDPKISYRNYISHYRLNLKNFIKSQKKQISKFEDMVEILMEALSQNYLTDPFTFPAFIKSNRTPPTISGLVIEIANLNKSNDNLKNERFFESRNWDFYLNMARNYGFQVDSDVPWRLVADIGSAEMLQYAARYGVTRTNEVLDVYFDNSSISYFLNFPEFMYNLYNYLKPNFLYDSYDSNGVMVPTIKQPRVYNSFESFMNEYGDDYFTELYCTLRYMEEENRTPNSEIEKTISNIIETQGIVGKSEAISIFEKTINKPFDYSGSLSYNINAGKVVSIRDDSYRSKGTVIKTLK